MRCAPVSVTVVVSLGLFLTAAPVRVTAGQAQKKGAPAKGAAPAENNAIPLKSIPA